MSTIFSAPINPERPRGGATCAKCSHLRTSSQGVTCAVGGPLVPCSQFRDASVERTFRRALKSGYFVQMRPA